MSTAHTPGPWSVHTEEGCDWPIVMSGGPSGRIVCNVNPESCPDLSSAPAFVKMPAGANARLIASAPDLLAALECILKRYESAGVQCYPEARREVIAARAAIDRATGGAA